MKKLKILGLCLVTGTTLNFSGCESSDSVTPPLITSSTYQGSGSNWKSVFKSDGSCELSESDNGISIKGTYKLLDSGYTQIEIISSNNTTLSVGSLIEGIELKNNSFMFKNGNKVISLINEYDIFSKNKSYNYNWVALEADRENDHNYSNWSPIGYNQFSFANNSFNGGKEIGYKLEYIEGYNVNISSSTRITKVSKGHFTTPNGNNTALINYYQSQNGYTMKNDTLRIFGLPQETNNIDALNFNKQYIGFVFESNNNIQTSKTVSVIPNNGIFDIKEITPSTNQISTNSMYKITLTNDKISNTSNGILKASINDGTNTDNMACAIKLNWIDNKNAILCTGYKPNTDESVLVGILLVNK